MRKGNQDTNVLALEQSLSNLSLEVNEVTGSGGRVEDEELPEMLASLNTSPGQKPGPTATSAAQTWATIKDDAEVREALAQDARDELMDGERDGTQDEPDPSEDEVEVVNAGKIAKWGIHHPSKAAFPKSSKFWKSTLSRVGLRGSCAGLRNGKTAFMIYML